jgi:4a-hydroxytetrahydrobiopterin dehydratase
MNETELLNSHCVERAPGTPPLPATEVERYLKLVRSWTLVEGGKGIRLKQRFDGFTAAVAFVNRVATLAEEEDHHPDVRIYSYRWLDLDLATHSIGGLSENDFIMAAKINRLLKEPPAP